MSLFIKAHCNPLSHNDSFKYPLSPEEADAAWEAHYPNIPSDHRVVKYLDIGTLCTSLLIAEC